jgi:hypothetical protein
VLSQTSPTSADAPFYNLDYAEPGRKTRICGRVSEYNASGRASMTIASNKQKNRRPLAYSALLLTAGLMLAGAAGYAQEESQQQKDSRNACINATGRVDCSNPSGPAPEVVNDLWNAIAFSPSRNIAAFAGSFTAPENAKAAALKRCASRAADCKIIVAAHDVCVAVAFEIKAGGLYRAAIGASKQDAEGKALPVCMAEGPQHCTVLAGCSRQPPILLLSQ